MKIIRNIIVSFSLFSRIPMPHFEWKEDDTKYAISFLPLIGLVIGAIEYLAIYYSTVSNLPLFVKALIWMLIPLVITGGFHVDGFMDVEDAFNSFKPKDEKLNILKDPHIGAFSVISLAMYGISYLALIYYSFFSIENIKPEDIWRKILPLCLGFSLVRGIAALTSIHLKHAKSSGMLHEETKSVGIISTVILVLEIMLILGITLWCDPTYSLAFISVEAIFLLWYRTKCNREFGGVTGDTTGYFIVVSELLVVLAEAVLAFWGA